MTTANQNPEQVARDQIDKRLAEDGWFVQDKKSIDFNVGLGICQSAFKFDSRSSSNFDPF